MAAWAKMVNDRDDSKHRASELPGRDMSNLRKPHLTAVLNAAEDAFTAEIATGTLPDTVDSVHQLRAHANPRRYILNPDADATTDERYAAGDLLNAWLHSGRP